MKMPPLPQWMPLHRHDGRFWETKELIELLVVRAGAAGAIYHRTREYRALISTIRTRNNTNLYRKGYAFDWKGLMWKNPAKQDRVVKDKQATAIKDDVVEYLTLGRIPVSVLPYVCEHLREAEVRVWADELVRARQTQKPRFAVAAE